MALTTLVDILTAIRAVLEATPLSFTATKEPFSAQRQSNLRVDHAYWLEDGGLVSSQPVGAHREVRIDAVEVRIARKAAFMRENDRATVLTELQDIERALIADGEAQGYHVRMAARSVARASGREYVVGTLRLTVDYDFEEVAS